MNAINRYTVGRKAFANLFDAIDYAEPRGAKVIDQVTRLIVWKPRA